MKTIYFDCFSGISGDMTLGALIDAGLDYKAWQAELARIDIEGWSVSKKKVTRAGIAATKLTVKYKGHQPHRGLSQITGIIAKSKISKPAKEAATRIFGRLAEAEARAHGVPVDKVHFHEVGAVDAIIDIVGTAIALDMMGIKKVCSSPLNLGSGMVNCAHGTFPVPAPATANLIAGFPAYTSDVKHELTTPTGAAIVTTLAEESGPMPVMTLASAGYGAGDLDIPGQPNLLRVFIGDTAGEYGSGYGSGTVELIETNIDDMDPRIYEHLMERLFGAGALDVWLTPVIMKKSRPAVTLSVLSDTASSARIIDIVMAETTTFGVRVSTAYRRILAREFREVKTRHGAVRVKLGLAGGKVVKAMPEYEDVKAVARKSGKPMSTVISEINKLFDYLS